MTSEPPARPRRRTYRRLVPAGTGDPGPPSPEELVGRYVRDALDQLPPAYAGRLENVDFVVRRRPSRTEMARMGLRGGASLYGLYQGVPLTARGSGYALPGYHLTPPDKITVFWEPLVRDFGEPRRLAAQVKKTVFHEIAHHFGISDADLRGTRVR